MTSTPPSPETIRAIARGIVAGRGDVVVERVAQGRSTYVYRLRDGETRLYLRVLPEDGASFAPEVRVLELLQERGVSVPQVVSFAHRDATVQRSVMVTTEISGRPLAEVGVGAHTPRVLFEAGRMLAVINTLPVDGFGWVARDQPLVSTFRGAHRTHRAFALERVDEHLAVLEAHVLSQDEIAQVRGLLRRYDGWLDEERAVLAHGDFDVTHIFQQGTHCSGIIDFGEIRGAGRWYDLGHFHLRDGETLPAPLLPWLLEGYRTVTTLPADAPKRISFAALLIALRALARLLVKRDADSRGAHYAAAGVAALRRDLAALHD